MGCSGHSLTIMPLCSFWCFKRTRPSTHMHAVLTETHKGRRLGGQNACSIWYIMYVDWTHCDFVAIDELFWGLSMCWKFDMCILLIENFAMSMMILHRFSLSAWAYASTNHMVDRHGQNCTASDIYSHQKHYELGTLPLKDSRCSFTTWVKNTSLQHPHAHGATNVMQTWVEGQFADCDVSRCFGPEGRIWHWKAGKASRMGSFTAWQGKRGKNTKHWQLAKEWCWKGLVAKYS